jgi:ribonuclease Z
VRDVLRPRAVRGQLPPELEIRVGGLTLRGTSIAARATAFAVPELGVALDVGRLTPTIAAQGTVLLSHAHLDHLSGVLAYLNLRARFHPDEPTRLVVPADVAPPLGEALAIMPGMESVQKRMRLDEVIVAAGPGSEIALAGGRALAFAVDHSVQTLGWSLRLESAERPALVFAADSSLEPFRADPGLLDARVAVVECTFVERGRRLAARLSRHAHLADWVELAPRLACDVLVLAHLPMVASADLESLAEPLRRAFAGTLVLWAR